MDAELVVLHGRHAGKRVRLPPAPFVIGRGPNCHLRPASPGVSRLHCAVAPCGPNFLLRDLKSRNGTYVNDRRVRRPTRLRDGDRIRVGEFTFQVVLPAELPLDQLPTNDRANDVAWLLRSPSEEELASLDSRDGTVETSATAIFGRGDASMVAGKYLVELVTKEPK
jgi:pSer/pThr/pTyr-binding forkhead associated (FHA) protein